MVATENLGRKRPLMHKNLPDGSDSSAIAMIGSRSYVAAAISILIVATILRLPHLGVSLWFDEAITANSARTTLQNLIEGTRTNSTPLGLPLLLFVIEKFSVSAWIVRAPSVVFSVGAIAVTLALPRVGIVRGYCLAVAAVLAISPQQIRYAQEVREYALSVFVAATLVYLFFKYLDKGSVRNLVLLAIGIAATPFLAYGSCFAALAVIVCTAFIPSDRGTKRWLLDTVVMIAAFAAAAVVSYITIAKYQKHMRLYWYLLKDYPPTVEGSTAVWVASSLKWLWTSFSNYIGAFFGGYETAALFVFLFIVTLSRLVLAPARLKRDPILLLFVVLVGGSVAAAFLRLYPFGAIRQQLYAAPVIILATVRAGALLCSQFDIQWRRLTIGGVAAIVLAASLMRIPATYGEREDIRSAVTIGLKDADPKNVYVYYMAVPAVDFHYRDSGFKRGTPGNPAAMADEAIQVASDGKLYLLFSQLQNNDDDLLIAELRARGWIVVRDERYIGSRAVYLNRLRSSARMRKMFPGRCLASAS
jgi:hypothetical protein